MKASPPFLKTIFALFRWSWLPGGTEEGAEAVQGWSWRAELCPSGPRGVVSRTQNRETCETFDEQIGAGNPERQAGLAPLLEMVARVAKEGLNASAPSPRKISHCAPHGRLYADSPLRRSEASVTPLRSRVTRIMPVKRYILPASDRIYSGIWITICRLDPSSHRGPLWRPVCGGGMGESARLCLWQFILGLFWTADTKHSDFLHSELWTIN